MEMGPSPRRRPSTAPQSMTFAFTAIGAPTVTVRNRATVAVGVPDLSRLEPFSGRSSYWSRLVTIGLGL